MTTKQDLIRLLLIGLNAIALVSCSLPPRQAWNDIQTRGLITHYMHPLGAPLTSSSSRQMVASNCTTPAVQSLAQSLIDTPLPSQLSADLPVARAVADLSGYVRSPYTTPGRLIDVRGMSAGSKVVCPYSQKPFIVPSGMTSSASQIAATPPAPRIQNTPHVVNPRPSQSAASSTPAPNFNVAAMTNPAPEPKLEPTPAPAPQAAPIELPYGSSISARPGFVNSPYAAKHQLVDVTGLPTGIEVKCPYTGKLFRVPPQ